MNVNALGIDWVHIPGSPFLMGSAPDLDKRAYGNEMPQHEVHLISFWISKTPITNRQYERYVRDADAVSPRHWRNAHPPIEIADHPVVWVDWFEAQAFCVWAGVRLPTEAEWEKAARGVDRRLYPWGHQKPTRMRCNQCHFFGGTTPVDALPLGASPYGVTDMAGNVWEWTASKAAPYPYVAGDGREDAYDDGGFRVLRGGGWRTVNLARCAFRDVGTRPGDAECFRGFRLARSTPPDA
jgi:formylglycine-generating enzyme required for sulfatase activity